MVGQPKGWVYLVMFTKFVKFVEGKSDHQYEFILLNSRVFWQYTKYNLKLIGNLIAAEIIWMKIYITLT